MNTAALMETWSALPLFTRGLIVIWVLEMISVPILTWIWGLGGHLQGIRLGVLLQAAAVTTILAFHWGIGRTGVAILTILLGAWVLEFVGSRTGVLFGPYQYTDRLQPQIAGVPLLIPLAWLMMLPPAWAIAEVITGALPPGFQRRSVFVVVSALAFTAWDLFLDPQMVKWQLWIWDKPPTGGYFGIPWHNYAGWLVSAAALTVAVAPDSLPLPSLLAIYGLTWFLETVGQLAFWNLRGSGLVGSVAMGSFLIAALVAM